MATAAQGAQDVVRAEAPRRVALSEGVWTALLIGVFAAYYAAPGLPLSLALLALAAFLCYVQLPLAVSLVPLAVPFFMLPKHLGHPTPEFSLGETAIVLCAACCAVQATRRVASGAWSLAELWRLLTRPRPLAIAIAVFFLAATAATLEAHYLHQALRWYRWVILEPLAYYVLVRLLLRDPRALRRALWSIAGAGLFVALLGLGQYLFRPGTLGGVYYVGYKPHPLHRFVTAVYGSPDNLGLLLDRAIPVAVALLLALLALRRRRRGEMPWRALLALALLVPMVAALLLSQSRGGIITALAVSVLAGLLWYVPRRRLSRAAVPWLALVGLGAVAALAAGAALVLAKIQHGLSTVERLWVWSSALHMIRDHPLLGVGPDNFLYYYFNPHVARYTTCIPQNIVPRLPATHYMDPRAWREPCLSHPHNIVLDAWLSTGLAGLLALAAVVVLSALYAWRALRRSRDGTARVLGVGVIAIVAATLIHGMVDNSVFVPDLAVFFWLAVALAASVVTATAIAPAGAATAAATAPAGAAPP